MDLLIILVYCSICVGIFKIFNIQVNKWSLTTAVLGGVALISSLLLLMNYNHPYSEVLQRYYVTTPIVPNVSGQIIEVTHKDATFVRKGDILFRMDPEPYQNKLDALKARMFRIEQDEKRALMLQRRGAISQRDVDQTQSILNELKAEISQALWEMHQTTYHAPSDGYILQIAARPGVRAVQLPMRPVMTFIPKEHTKYVGWFRQNSMLRLKVGDDAEIAFTGIPGKVFSGRVTFVAPYVSEGAVSPYKPLLENPKVGGYMSGRIAVTIEITDPRYEQFEQFVPGGATGIAAIYTEHYTHVGMMRRVLLRMLSWLNYLYPFK